MKCFKCAQAKHFLTKDLIWGLQHLLWSFQGRYFSYCRLSHQLPGTRGGWSFHSHSNLHFQDCLDNGLHPHTVHFSHAALLFLLISTCRCFMQNPFTAKYFPVQLDQKPCIAGFRKNKAEGIKGKGSVSKDAREQLRDLGQVVVWGKVPPLMHASL